MVSISIVPDRRFDVYVRALAADESKRKAAADDDKVCNGYKWCQGKAGIDEHTCISNHTDGNHHIVQLIGHVEPGLLPCLRIPLGKLVICKRVQE